MACQPKTTLTFATSSTCFQRHIQVHTMRPPSGSNAKQNPRGYREGESESYNCAVNPDVRQSWNVPWVHHSHYLDTKPRHEKAQRTAHQRQQKALCEQLPY